MNTFLDGELIKLLLQNMSEMDCLMKIFTTYGIETGTSRVLDIGCGNGKFTLELAAVFDEVLAIDDSKEVVEKVTKLSRNRIRKNVTVMQMNAKDLHTLGDNKFNVIIAMLKMQFYICNGANSIL